MAVYTSEEKQHDFAVVSDGTSLALAGNDLSTNDEGKLNHGSKGDDEKQMVDVKINLDVNDKTIEILYKNKVLACDIDTFIESYLLSNIFRTNDKIIKLISKNKPNLVNETKTVLSIIYTIQALDFNIIFEIPFNDFELNLSKCDEKEKIDEIFSKVQALNNIISFNELVLNRYDIKISKPFHNFTLNECMKYLDSMYMSYNHYNTQPNHSHHHYSTPYHQYSYIQSFSNQFYTSSGHGITNTSSNSYINDNTLAEAVSLLKENFDVKQAERCKLLFDIFENHEYYLDEYNNRFEFNHNSNQSNRYPNLYLDASIFEIHEKSPRDMHSIFGKDIVIGAISFSKSINVGKRYKQLKCQRFYQITVNSTHSANNANKTQYSNCIYVYVPTIERNKILLKFVFAVVPKYTSNGSNMTTTMQIVKSNPVDYFDGNCSSQVYSVISNPISATVTFNTQKYSNHHYTTVSASLPLHQIIFNKIF